MISNSVKCFTIGKCNISYVDVSYSLTYMYIECIHYFINSTLNSTIKSIMSVQCNLVSYCSIVWCVCDSVFLNYYIFVQLYTTAFVRLTNPYEKKTIILCMSECTYEQILYFEAFSESRQTLLLLPHYKIYIYIYKYINLR